MIKTSVEAIIFDWAGTTVDFGSRAPMGAFVKLFQSEGIEMTIPQARIPMGINKWDHINALLSLSEIQSQWFKMHGKSHTDADVDRLLDIFVPMNKVSIRECGQLIPGVAELSKTLRERHIKIGSTTGYTKELLDILLPIAKEQGYEADALSYSGDTQLGRPSAQMMHKCAVQLGLDNPLAFIKVDDTEPGIQEGKAFGCWTVGVAVSGNALGLSFEELNAMPDGEANRLKNSARLKMQEMHPDYVIDSVADLLPIIDEINTRLDLGEKPNSYNN
ncbi:phosphonoacetaldehyde hydrolase [Polynucleobacter sp. CS-Odin-A6]|uniref:phosphonoacetaldehyde hydrolase n=1 Tax=Polynucleobacter sp. CS-Odin-A6 TaxID=2689106 RepID=UPI001C0D92D8|nr:phosphonoacetaldehyde hydrolase [Polynucleobacter sp. CS-Odin-A6]MBU3621477.1 phosphonoacetaldehyde hydrolase [Polynucleobacter sp. CS-Odin-A6]